MIFLLNDDEKIAFLKVVYSVMMFDRHHSDPEVVILDTLRSELFRIVDFEYTQIKDNKKIVEEVDKVHSVIPVVYLFNIMYELEKYNPKTHNFKEKINDILDEVRFKNEILKSKLFIHHQPPKDDKKVMENEEKENKNMLDELYEKVVSPKNLDDFTNKMKNLFK